jgi:hypothetical protein
MSLKKFLEYGGFAAGTVLIAFGIVSIVMGFNGRDTVDTSLKNEYIVGTPDMTPAAITAEAKKAGLDLSKLQLPTCTVAGETVDSGSRARCFAQYMRIHVFEATGGLTYAQMGRYLTASGKPTNDTAAAAKDPKTGQPVENGLRNLWVTETALTTALNTSYLATQIALFGIVVGFALLLTGIGLVILALASFGRFFERRESKPAATIAPTPA